MCDKGRSDQQNGSDHCSETDDFQYFLNNGQIFDDVEELDNDMKIMIDKEKPFEELRNNPNLFRQSAGLSDNWHKSQKTLTSPDEFKSISVSSHKRNSDRSYKRSISGPIDVQMKSSEKIPGHGNFFDSGDSRV